MEIDLTPKLAKKVYGGNGGNYYAWCPDELPMLREANIGAAKLSLEKDGFALPRYSDSPKVAYVLQGSGVAGIVLPEKEEKVLPIKTGDSIALPFGVVSWWYNKEDTELIILFLGETSKGHKAGSFTDFFLTGTNGIFTGFTTEFVGRAWDLEESVVKTLVGNQSGITGGGWLRNWKLKLLVENWSSQRRFSSMMLRTIRPCPIDSGFFKILEGGKMNLPIVRNFLKMTFLTILLGIRCGEG